MPTKQQLESRRATQQLRKSAAIGQTVVNRKTQMSGEIISLASKGNQLVVKLDHDDSIWKGGLSNWEYPKALPRLQVSA